MTHGVLTDLARRIDELFNEWRWSEITPFAEELEKQLRFLPRKDREIRQAWIMLARVEAQRLQADKFAGRSVNTSRLRLLREEAENVSD